MELGANMFEKPDKIHWMEYQMTEWRDHQVFVLKELERLNNNFEKLIDKMSNHEKDLVTLKVKASILGTLGGIAVTVVLAIFEFFRRQG